MTISDTTLRNLAEQLLAVIQEMATLGTNPVLLTLQPEPSQALQIVDKKKYFFPPVELPGIELRGFYHCHDYPDKPADEHGHFHFFIQLDVDHPWQHLAALSINHNSQPFAWSTVNQWVTDSDWAGQDKFSQLVDQLVANKNQSLLHQWIIGMISLYRNSLLELIKQRDEQLSRIKSKLDNSDILRDRNIYLLSRVEINLKVQLSNALVHTQEG